MSLFTTLTWNISMVEKLNEHWQKHTWSHLVQRPSQPTLWRHRGRSYDSMVLPNDWDSFKKMVLELPPRWEWSECHKKQVAHGIKNLAGSWFTCSHPNAIGDKTRVVGLHGRADMTLQSANIGSSGCTNGGKIRHCDVVFFVRWYTPVD